MGDFDWRKILFAVNECADRLTAQCVGEVAVRPEVEDDDRDVVVHAKAERGGVHHIEAL